MSGAPRTPAEIGAFASLVHLAERYYHHAGVLVEQGAGIGDPLPNADIAAHAVAALVYQTALAEHALYTRWSNARDALAHGATLEQVAAAIGTDPDGVRIGLGLWASNQHRYGHITAAEYEDVKVLILREDDQP